MKPETDNSLSSLLLHLKNRSVRDLAWACFAPPLMHTPELSDSNSELHNCGLALSSKRRRRLVQLDNDPSALLAALENSEKLRLGIYFERLWHFFLEWDEDVELLAHNLAVHDGQRTIGEFDCLYFCRDRNLHVHLELAVKFFLGHRQATVGLAHYEHESSLHEWIGPNTRDQLDRKIARLTEHQIQLSAHPSALPLLNQIGVDQLGGSILHKEIEIKGRLFQSGLDPLAAPYAYNLVTPLSKWWPVSALAKQHEKSAAVSYTILDKRLWLAPLNKYDEVARLDSQTLRIQLEKHFEQGERPQQVAALSDLGQELERFFVVPADWPEGPATKTVTTAVKESQSNQS